MVSVLLAGCGLSLGGLGSGLETSAVDASLLGPDAGGDLGSGKLDGGGDAAVGASHDGSGAPAADATADGPFVCVPYDAGLNGALALSTFVVRGNASYDENSDGRITLTDSDTNQAGAAWEPTEMPAGISGFDLTWSFRVGPSDTPGDGVTFAVLTGGAPGVGGTGAAVGLQNIAPAVGGAILTGFAVDMDMFQDPTDPTDLGPGTLKLITMPGFVVVGSTLVPSALNDGNPYAIDVSWRAPSTLTATLTGPAGAVFKVTSGDPGLAIQRPEAFIGFTGATGGISDSHNEVAGITVIDVCQ